jgi:2-polyprenyl-3-methyl-5-hydroxy-6-metoxy-1,4-benzoquinol methylase
MNSSGSKGSLSISPEEIREIAYAFQRIRVLLTAYELDLFTAVGDGEKSSNEVAEAISADVHATDRLMNALCAVGLMTKKDGRFSNTPVASRFLVRNSPERMSGLMHTVHLWDTWSTLTQAVRQGTAVASRQVNDRGEQWLTAFIAAMHDRASKQAPAVIAQIDLSGVSRMLDVGGGSGAYAMAFARAGQGIRATVFDLPNVIPLTNAHIKEERLSNKVDTVSGDYLKDELGTGFDLVFLSSIIHSNSSDQNRSLIQKCAHALCPGGRVIVQDFIMDEDRINPPHGAFFALNMLVGTDAVDTYTEAEVRTWMEEAGLSGILRKDTPYGTAQIDGKKTGVSPWHRSSLRYLSIEYRFEAPIQWP